MKKMKDKVILIISIERVQHDALRYIAYEEKKSIAAIAREAFDRYLGKKGYEKDITEEASNA